MSNLIFFNYAVETTCHFIRNNKLLFLYLNTFMVDRVSLYISLITPLITLGILAFEPVYSGSLPSICCCACAFYSVIPGLPYKDIRHSTSFRQTSKTLAFFSFTLDVSLISMLEFYLIIDKKRISLSTANYLHGLLLTNFEGVSFKQLCILKLHIG